jgi:hypothetical protein
MIKASGGGSLSVIDEALFKDLGIFHSLLTDSLILKRVNTVGCKMKVY